MSSFYKSQQLLLLSCRFWKHTVSSYPSSPPCCTYSENSFTLLSFLYYSRRDYSPTIPGLFWKNIYPLVILILFGSSSLYHPCFVSSETFWKQFSHPFYNILQYLSPQIFTPLASCHPCSVKKPTHILFYYGSSYFSCIF